MHTVSDNKNEQREGQAALDPDPQKTFSGTLPAHARSFSHFESLCRLSVSLCRDTSEVEVPRLRIELCHLPRVEQITEGKIDVLLSTVFVFHWG